MRSRNFFLLSSLSWYVILICWCCCMCGVCRILFLNICVVFVCWVVLFMFLMVVISRFGFLWSWGCIWDLVVL